MADYTTKEILDNIFFTDGSLRDIHVNSVDLADWQKFLDWVESSDYEITLYTDGLQTAHEFKADALFEKTERNNIMLTIGFARILIHCHFFSEDEMEFDLDPKQIKSRTEVDAAFDFMLKLASLLDKKVTLTLEDTHENPLACVRPSGTLILLC